MSMSAHPEGSGHPPPTQPRTPPSQFDTGVRADGAATADPVDAAVEVARIRSATFAGRDPDHLASAEVDGDGVVIRIRLAATARCREPRVVESAVLSAIAAAQGEIRRAWGEAAARWSPEGVDHDAA